jgi:hypothetical protein
MSTADEEESLWPVFEASGATIRMPDEREAAFMADGFDDLMAGSNEMQITGSGEKPF